MSVRTLIAGATPCRTMGYATKTEPGPFSGGVRRFYLRNSLDSGGDSVR